MGTDPGWTFLEVTVLSAKQVTRSSAQNQDGKNFGRFQDIRVSEIVVKDNGKMNRLGKCSVIVT